MRCMLCYGTKRKSPSKASFLPKIRKELGDKFESSSREGMIKLVELLSDSTIPQSNQWPIDNDIEDTFHWNAGDVDKEVLSYILYRIECHKSGNSSQFDNIGKFNKTYTHKHIKPLNWQGTWHLPIGEGILYNDLFHPGYRPGNRHRPSETDLRNKSEPYKEALRVALDRMDAVQSAGNLTIIETNLIARQKSIEESRLQLNKEICKICNPDDWDVKQNSQEGRKKLTSLFCEIWPSADIFIEKIIGSRPKSISDQMIESAPHTFMTYTGREELSQNLTYQYEVEGINSSGERVNLKKDTILFAFPAKASQALEILSD